MKNETMQVDHYDCPECSCPEEFGTHCRNCGVRLRGSTARLITTLDCNRKCHYCCNTTTMLAQATIITDLAELGNYSEVCITGGEPMLYPDETEQIIYDLRFQNPHRKIYLYTALATDMMVLDEMFYQKLSGIHYTVHYNSTQDEVVDHIYNLEELSFFYKDKSFRMYIESDVAFPVQYTPNLWSRVESFAFVEDCPLPKNEDLFILAK